MGPFSYPPVISAVQGGGWEYVRGGFPVFMSSPHLKKGRVFTILPTGRLEVEGEPRRECLNGVLEVGTVPGRFSENPPGFE